MWFLWNFGPLLFSLGLLALVGYGLVTGQALTKYGAVSRHDSPALFWMLTAIKGLVAAALLIWQLFLWLEPGS